MYNTIRQFPQQFLKSYEILRQQKLPEGKAGSVGRTFYAAMGGSSLPAYLVNDYLDDFLRLELVQDYRLPQSAGPQDLVIAASFSGNTEETLAVFAEASARGCRMIAMSNGGKLQKMAEQAGTPWIPIPNCIQPRCATGYFFASLLSLFHRIGLVPSPQEKLAKLSAFLEKIQDECETVGKSLAVSLKDRVPIIYGSNEFYGVCRIWKIKINENAKVQSFFNVFPELNHNEMVGFSHLLMKPALVFLESRFMHPRIARRMQVMQELLENEMPILRLKFSGSELLHEMFESLAVADYTSFYLAQAYGIDPAPVEMVEEFKRKL